MSAVCGGFGGTARRDGILAAMGADDVEFLRGVYEEWSRGDFSREYFADDVVSHGYGFVDLGRTAEGLEEVIEAQRDWLSQWERPFTVDAERFIPAGDAVVVLIRWHGTGRGSGVVTEAEGAHVWEIRDGKAARWDIYRDRERALADAGIDPDEAGSQ
jgi:uncharacterized protein